MKHTRSTALKLLKVSAAPYTIASDKLGLDEDLHILVEIEETTQYDNGVLQESTLAVWYEVLFPMRCAFLGRKQFDAQYQRSFNGLSARIAITGKIGSSSVFLDPVFIRGRRIGTYVMNEIVTWAKQWPDADVKLINLNLNQAGNTLEFSTQRRNRFYEHFGIAFDYTDPATEESGLSRPMKAEGLKECTSWKSNIEELPLAQEWKRLFDENRTLTQDRDIARENTVYWKDKATRNPIEASRIRKNAVLATSAFWILLGAYLWWKGILVF